VKAGVDSSLILRAKKSFSRYYCSWYCQEYSQANTNIWK